VIREAYVDLARAAGRGAQRLGVMDRLARRRGRAALYLRSLPAIYDVDAMLELDTPWWTFRAIDRVERFLADKGGWARVFEFGAGASTPWLARRSAEVHAVEHDVAFAEHIAAAVADAGAHLHVTASVRATHPQVGSSQRNHRERDFSDYVSTIDQVGGRFDLVVIDGRARETALQRTIPHLAPDGLVLLDDAWRPRYRRALRAARDLETTWTVGAAPSLPYPSCTALVRERRR
jgi:hypothetical protein